LRERLLSGPLIDFYVGEEKKHWALHRNLLLYHSDGIQAELSQSPEKIPRSMAKTTQEGARLDLPDIEPAGFEQLVKWLYQGNIDDVSQISDPQDKYAYAVACYNLHLLCDRFVMPKLKNVAMDQYRKSLNEARLVPDAEEIKELYRRSPVGSPFRPLMVRIAARQIMDPDGDKDAESYRKCFEQNSAFAVELVNAIKWSIGGVLLEDPTDTDDCIYHDHGGGLNCHTNGKGKSAQITNTTHHPLLQLRDRAGNIRPTRRKSTASSATWPIPQTSSLGTPLWSRPRRNQSRFIPKFADRPPSLDDVFHPNTVDNKLRSSGPVWAWTFGYRALWGVENSPQ
jgi:hypothetical protein